MTSKFSVFSLINKQWNLTFISRLETKHFFPNAPRMLTMQRKKLYMTEGLRMLLQHEYFDVHRSSWMLTSQQGLVHLLRNTFLGVAATAAGCRRCYRSYFLQFELNGQNGSCLTLAIGLPPNMVCVSDLHPAKVRLVQWMKSGLQPAAYSPPSW
jgi:hypothetical protein